MMIDSKKNGVLLSRDIGIARRYRAELRFRIYGILALVFALTFLVSVLSSVFVRGYGAFWQTNVTLPVFFDPSVLDPKNERDHNPSVLIKAKYQKLAVDALISVLKKKSDDVPLRDVRSFLSEGARGQLRSMVEHDKSLVGKTVNVSLLVSGDIDSAFKGLIDLSISSSRRKISDRQIIWMNDLAKEGVLEKKFNSGLFLFGGSSRPETSGILVALVGSFYIMCIVLCLSLPFGVACAIHLEEFAPRNRIVDAIEVTINNLAAVPSIVFGLLGLSLFVNFLGMPRSSALVGGLTLSLMTLPVIVVVTRASLAAVPSSVRFAALALGASKVQMVFHHVLPLAMPGIITGSIIGLARALGETAPLLVIGMVAFVAQPPTTPFDPATALPVQIYMWANQAERGFSERMSGTILILLVFLLVINIAAIILRNHLQKR